MRKLLLIAGLSALVFASAAFASDTITHPEVRSVVEPPFSNSGKTSLDGSVRMFFAGQDTPVVLSELGEARTSRKANAVGKRGDFACKWAMLSALLALQQQAKSLGANAVVDIASNYDNQPYRSATQYECHSGAIMSGVALKGRYAKIADR
ncbi:MAG: excinuclease ATPase subunit [Luteimonas sp.]